MRLLRLHRRRQLARKLELGPAWIDSGKVFTRTDGGVLRPDWISEKFRGLIAAAGLPPIRLHDLRHTAATLMLAARIDMKVIQETLGHSTLATTSDIYTSVLPGLLAEAAEAAVAIVPRKRTLGHPSGTHKIEADGRAPSAETGESAKPQVNGGLSAIEADANRAAAPGCV